MLTIRRAVAADHDALWAIFEPVIRAGETYALPQDLGREGALAYWFAGSNEAFVAEDDGVVLGTYTLRVIREGGGDHVANCGYMTAVNARGKGVGRAMLEHSLARARARGFRAMQFSFVVSTNESAVRLWQAGGFEVVGRLPGAFRHPKLGFVDALVMYRQL
jgi:L-amino acid N-acyltransferase YncA